MDQMKTLLDLANYYKSKANEFEEKAVIAESHSRQYSEAVHTLSAQIAELKSQLATQEETQNAD